VKAPPPGKILLVQTAFAGDVILSLAAAETLHAAFPNALIDYLVRKGLSELLEGHPFIRKVWEWNKASRVGSLFRLIPGLRQEKYDAVILFQRHLRSGLLALGTGASVLACYTENPLAPFFRYRMPYFEPRSRRPSGTHEIERCNRLAGLPWQIPESYHRKPRLYPPAISLESLGLKEKSYGICAPGSLWFTKRLPPHRWVELCRLIPQPYTLLFIGSADDRPLCEAILLQLPERACLNLAGRTRFPESAALMQKAAFAIVQDSAPLHIASAVNTPVCVLYGSTTPELGFGPLSDVQHIVETEEALPCRPCGLHGHPRCPERHFRCMETLPLRKVTDFLNRLHADLQL
jgi:heptosyltransferase-2